MRKSRISVLGTFVLFLIGSAWGSDPRQPQPAETGAPDPAAQMALFQAQLAEQQKQNEKLRAVVAEQAKPLERLDAGVPQEPRANHKASLVEVASLSSMSVPPVGFVKPDAAAWAVSPAALPNPQAVTPAPQAGGPTVAE